ncbi:Abi-like protein [Frankia canadensis]|uniref:Abi-like protein n=1 Tax=Frankia canadensis TaxID=1836972 RepID=A0A2I2KX64_9ACTN|nr:Abi family protein [Frankia canadensis]SNQ50246.1 Abi-like protein [Frankia canadensis]SOU57536.1 Abi-like protein [Frankia canadensis]
MSNALTPPHVLAVQIRRRLSAERLDPYERACNHDLEQAVALYEWNSSISAAFHEVLGLFEIVLRNALHDQLTLWHQRQRRPGQWFDDPAGILEAHRRRDVADAYARLRRDGKVITPGRMIAELTFGFWRYLLTRRYETTLWTPALRRAFPNLRPAQRTRIYSPVDSLVRLRNRVAHHEPIHSRPLATLHRDLLRVTGHLDASVEEWISSRSRVPALLLARPPQPPAVHSSQGHLPGDPPSDADRARKP